MKKNKTFEEYLRSVPEKWNNAILLLREIVLKSNLKETIKWGMPVYEYRGKNVVGIGCFNNYAGLWFFQGALLADKEQLLVNAQEGKTKAMRQLRFYHHNNVNETVILEYILESMENFKAGKEIKPEKKPLVLADELKEVLNSNLGIKQSFNNLSLGKRREFSDYISSAKRASTRVSRIQKIIPMIIEGVGLNDRYR